MSEFSSSTPFLEPPICSRCGRVLELPVDLSKVSVNCPGCGTETILQPSLIQARQRQLDLQVLALQHSREVEQQRLLQQRVLLARQSASRRTTITIWVLLGVFLGLPLLGVGALFALGFKFSRRAFEAMQDQTQNGILAISSELRKKESEGCSRVAHPPQIQLGGSGTFRLPLKANGACVHLLGSTSVQGAALTVEQVSHESLAKPLPSPAPAFDYRFCPAVDQVYEFTVTSNQSGPFTIAAVYCPRTTEEGLVRSQAEDPVTTAVAAVREWAEEFQAKGCKLTSNGFGPVQGTQNLEIESSRGGPCFRLLVASHFSDAPLAVRLSSPRGKPLAEPAPASRVQLEYCPSETGKQQLEIVPSTKDHFAFATMDCPRHIR